MSKRYYTREELGNKANLPPYSYLSDAHMKMGSGGISRATFFHSDVYFVRAALEKRTGLLFPLPDVAKAMKEQGWRDVIQRRTKEK